MNGRRSLFRFGFLGLFAGQAFLTPGFAQSNACPSSQPAHQAQLPGTRVIVDQVEFHGDNPLSESEQANLVGEIQQHSFVISPGEPEKAWVDEATEVVIRGALQNKGYFRASVEGTPYLIRAVDSELHYAVRIELASGPQYRLGDVRFVSAQDTPLALSENLLRQQLDLKSDDLFDVSKIRLATENITKLYSRNGYLDEVPEPDTLICDEDSRIDLTLKVDEGISYRIGGIDLLGGQTEASRQLPLPQSTGDPVDRILWRKFFEDNKSHFPAGATFESSIKMTRNTRDSTIRIALDFQSCPEIRHTFGPDPILRTKAGP